MLSSDKNIDTFAQLFEAVKKYIELQKEYLKFDVIYKFVQLVAGFTFFLVAFVLGVSMLFYVSMAFAFWIVPYVGSQAGGFAVVAIFFFCLLLLVAFNRKKWIEKPIVSYIVRILLDKKD